MLSVFPRLRPLTADPGSVCVGSEGHSTSRLSSSSSSPSISPSSFSAATLPPARPVDPLGAPRHFPASSSPGRRLSRPQPPTPPTRLPGPTPAANAASPVPLTAAVAEGSRCHAAVAALLQSVASPSTVRPDPLDQVAQHPIRERALYQAAPLSPPPLSPPPPPPFSSVYDRTNGAVRGALALTTSSSSSSRAATSSESDSGNSDSLGITEASNSNSNSWTNGNNRRTKESRIQIRCESPDEISGDQPTIWRHSPSPSSLRVESSSPIDVENEDDNDDKGATASTAEDPNSFVEEKPKVLEEDDRRISSSTPNRGRATNHPSTFDLFRIDERRRGPTPVISCAEEKLVWVTDSAASTSPPTTHPYRRPHPHLPVPLRGHIQEGRRQIACPPHPLYPHSPHPCAKENIASPPPPPPSSTLPNPSPSLPGDAWPNLVAPLLSSLAAKYEPKAPSAPDSFEGVTTLRERTSEFNVAARIAPDPLIPLSENSAPIRRSSLTLSPCDTPLSLSKFSSSSSSSASFDANVTSQQQQQQREHQPSTSYLPNYASFRGAARGKRKQTFDSEAKSSTFDSEVDAADDDDHDDDKLEKRATSSVGFPTAANSIGALDHEREKRICCGVASVAPIGRTQSPPARSYSSSPTSSSSSYSPNVPSKSPTSQPTSSPSRANRCQLREHPNHIIAHQLFPEPDPPIAQPASNDNTGGKGGLRMSAANGSGADPGGSRGQKMTGSILPTSSTAAAAAAAAGAQGAELPVPIAGSGHPWGSIQGSSSLEQPRSRSSDRGSAPGTPPPARGTPSGSLSPQHPAAPRSERETKEQREELRGDRESRGSDVSPGGFRPPPTAHGELSPAQRLYPSQFPAVYSSASLSALQYSPSLYAAAVAAAAAQQASSQHPSLPHPPYPGSGVGPGTPGYYQSQYGQAAAAAAAVAAAAAGYQSSSTGAHPAAANLPTHPYHHFESYAAVLASMGSHAAAAAAHAAHAVASHSPAGPSSSSAPSLPPRLSPGAAGGNAPSFHPAAGPSGAAGSPQSPYVPGPSSHPGPRTPSGSPGPSGPPGGPGPSGPGSGPPSLPPGFSSASRSLTGRPSFPPYHPERESKSPPVGRSGLDPSRIGRPSPRAMGPSVSGGPIGPMKPPLPPPHLGHFSPHGRFPAFPGRRGLLETPLSASRDYPAAYARHPGVTPHPSHAHGRGAPIPSDQMASAAKRVKLGHPPHPPQLPPPSHQGWPPPAATLASVAAGTSSSSVVRGPPTSTATAAVSGSTSGLPQIPAATAGQQIHYPPHFMKGSIIELANGELKRVEDLRTEDFVSSASVSGDLRIDSSTVVKIEEFSDRGTAVLGFSVGDHRVNVTVEATLEHPFFVFGQGWSSVTPDRTLQRYGLPCHKLSVGDVCVSLTHSNAMSGSSAAATEPRPSANGGGASSGDTPTSSVAERTSQASTTSVGSQLSGPTSTALSGHSTASTFSRSQHTLTASELEGRPSTTSELSIQEPGRGSSSLNTDPSTNIPPIAATSSTPLSLLTQPSDREAEKASPLNGRGRAVGGPGIQAQPPQLSSSRLAGFGLPIHGGSASACSPSQPNQALSSGLQPHLPLQSPHYVHPHGVSSGGAHPPMPPITAPSASALLAAWAAGGAQAAQQALLAASQYQQQQQTPAHQMQLHGGAAFSTPSIVTQTQTTISTSVSGLGLAPTTTAQQHSEASRLTSSSAMPTQGALVPVASTAAAPPSANRRRRWSAPDLAKLEYNPTEPIPPLPPAPRKPFTAESSTPVAASLVCTGHGSTGGTSTATVSRAPGVRISQISDGKSGRIGKGTGARKGGQSPS